MLSSQVCFAVRAKIRGWTHVCAAIGAMLNQNGFLYRTTNVAISSLASTPNPPKQEQYDQNRYGDQKIRGNSFAQAVAIVVGVVWGHSATSYMINGNQSARMITQGGL